MIASKNSVSIVSGEVVLLDHISTILLVLAFLTKLVDFFSNLLKLIEKTLVVLVSLNQNAAVSV